MRAIATTLIVILGGCTGASNPTTPPPPTTHTLRTFERVQLESRYFSGGATFADFDGDGRQDIVSGPFVWYGPDFTTKVTIYPGEAFDKREYSNNLHAFVYDFDGDGDLDPLFIGKPVEDPTAWYANPGDRTGGWQRQVVLQGAVFNESPRFGDITGDGVPELIYTHAQESRLGYAGPSTGWDFVPIGARGDYNPHGLGIGDVDGDGRVDVLEARGWWRQPRDANADWTLQEVDLGSGAQIFTADLDGDGDQDIVSSLDAHGYGLAWFEQEDGRFTRRLIMGRERTDNPYGVRFTQLHGVYVTDVDGDGVSDIVTGKNHWAHGPDQDPEAQAPAVLYWFQTVRGPQLDFVPRRIDDASGVGRQFTAGDVDGDGLTDVVQGNKLGIFLFRQIATQVAEEEWRAAQPTRTSP